MLSKVDGHWILLKSLLGFKTITIPERIGTIRFQLKGTVSSSKNIKDVNLCQKILQYFHCVDFPHYFFLI